MGMAKSYGIVVYDRFDWLIKKGDLVWSNRRREIRSRSFWLSAKSCVNRKYDLPLFSYSRKHEDDDAPEWWQDGQFGKLLGQHSNPSMTERKHRGRASRFRSM